MNDIMHRLETAIERAKKRKDDRMVRELTIIRDGALYGSKHDPQRVIREFYLGEGERE